VSLLANLLQTKQCGTKHHHPVHPPGDAAASQTHPPAWPQYKPTSTHEVDAASQQPVENWMELTITFEFYSAGPLAGGVTAGPLGCVGAVNDLASDMWGHGWGSPTGNLSSSSQTRRRTRSDHNQQPGHNLLGRQARS
jgi:hypothetical protein